MPDTTLQDFDIATDPSLARSRIPALRAALEREEVAAFMIPRSDAHQGENVAPHDERLAWATGFTGSAGLAIVAAEAAALFVDGRYTLQARAQVDAGIFTFKSIPEDKPRTWLEEQLPGGAALGFDPWLMTCEEHETLQKALSPKGIALRGVPNLVDAIWEDQPPPPKAPARPHDIAYAGRSHDDKRAQIAATLKASKLDAAVLTLPESIAWLLNIRGGDVARTPVVLCFAIICADGSVDLFIDPAKRSPALDAHLGADVRCHAPEAFVPHLGRLTGTIGLDRKSAPVAIETALEKAEISWTADPCVLPKATKNETELSGARDAHARDAVAMAHFLSWLDAEAPGGTLTEIEAAEKLEACRRDTGALMDISFETISGAGPNGAIVHYRVNRATNRSLRPGELYLVDSGGQYLDGTTDITRTIAVGTPPAEAKRAFTGVLKGMIAISQTVFPKGTSGRDIDGFARRALWQMGLDYDHGTGHGVGAYLSVHEGPASISKRSAAALEPGMILSNEPGCYKEGAFGIRIENLIVVRPAEIPGGGDRPMHSFETLTYVPIDLALVDVSLLTPHERDWINSYHAACRQRIMPHVSGSVLDWLNRVTREL